MTWLAATGPGGTPLQQVTGLRPELQPLLDAYLAETWAAGDPLLLELCRLRIATLHGDRTQQRLRHADAVAAGLTEELVAALPRYRDAPGFTDHQRHCLAYAEQYVLDVHGITDADAAAVKAGLGDAGFVAFTVALGLLDGIGRMRLVLGLDDDPPPAPTVVPSPLAATY